MAAVVAGLVAFAAYRGATSLRPRPSTSSKARSPCRTWAARAESPTGTAPVTTVKEYSFKPAERLPELKEASHTSP